MLKRVWLVLPVAGLLLAGCSSPAEPKAAPTPSVAAASPTPTPSRSEAPKPTLPPGATLKDKVEAALLVESDSDQGIFRNGQTFEKSFQVANCSSPYSQLLSDKSEAGQVVTRVREWQTLRAGIIGQTVHGFPRTSAAELVTKIRALETSCPGNTRDRLALPAGVNDADAQCSKTEPAAGVERHTCVAWFAQGPLLIVTMGTGPKQSDAEESLGYVLRQAKARADALSSQL